MCVQCAMVLWFKERVKACFVEVRDMLEKKYE
jgi:hypothetical protein